MPGAVFHGAKVERYRLSCAGGAVVKTGEPAVSATSDIDTHRTGPLVTPTRAIYSGSPRYSTAVSNHSSMEAAASMRDVIIIGAGISGLSGAKVLYEQSLDVLVLEARDRVGGRTFTRRDPSYDYCDVGGAYVGPTQDRILRLSKELGLETYKVNNIGDNVHFSHGKGIRFQGSWPRFWNPFAWLDVNNLFRKMDEMLIEIPLESPWSAPHAEQWDLVTVQQFFDQVCWTEAAKEFGRAFINANISMEPSEVSLLWLLWYVKSAGGSKRIWEVENGGQERKFVGGSMQVSERIADILGDRVRLNMPVRSISEEQGVITVETDKEQFKAKHVILAVAPSLHLKIHFTPPLSAHRTQLIQRVPMGSCIKNNVFYEKAFWREKGYNGYGSVADGIEPICNMVDDCKPDGSHPAITGFIVGDPGRRLAAMTLEDRKRETCEFYARLFKSEEALHPVGYEENNWMAESYSGGCYTSTYPPGVMTRFGRELRQPHGRVYFAGTELAVQWSGYMDGAVEAGERAAREVLHQRGEISADEIWQEEPPSQEVPALDFEDTLAERLSPSVDGALTWLALGAASGVCAYTLYKHPHRVQSVMEKIQSIF